MFEDKKQGNRWNKKLNCEFDLLTQKYANRDIARITPRFMSYIKQYTLIIFSWKGIKRKHDIDYFGHLCNSGGLWNGIFNLFTTTGKKPLTFYR